jgi:hypothetical protein
MRTIHRFSCSVLTTLLALGLASSASAVLLEIEIRATGINVGVDPGTTYTGVSMVALGTYDSGDVAELDQDPGLVNYVPVDFSITFSGGAGSFTSIGLGVWDFDDPDNGLPGALLVSDPTISVGFALGTDPAPGDIGFDLTQPFALASFPLSGVLSGAFPTTSGHELSLSCGSEDVGAVEGCGRFSVEIRESAIPEPSAALLFAVGLAVTGTRIRRSARLA